MKKKIIIAVAAVIVIAIFGVLFIKSGVSAPVYKTSVLKKMNIQQTIATTGTINPPATKRAAVSSLISGRVDKILVNFNQVVKKGERLLLLETSLLEAKVNQDEANLQSAEAGVGKAKFNLTNCEKNLKDTQALYDAGIASAKDLADVTLQYENGKIDFRTSETKMAQAKSQLNSSRIDLEHAKILSPIAGVVVNIIASPGQTVASGFTPQTLVEVADLTDMEINCSVDEAVIGLISVGQAVKFKVSTFPDTDFSGKVKEIRNSPTLVSNVNSYPVIVSVDTPKRIKPGMTANVEVILDSVENVLGVPNNALKFTPDLSAEEMATYMPPTAKSDTKSPADKGAAARQKLSGARKHSDIARIWKLNPDQTLSMVTVRIGITDSMNTEIKGIISGELKEGETIITGSLTEAAAVAQRQRNRLRF
jgi:HlyD family secretion protein